jgi:chemotaxis protein methyltransferase CheR
MSNVVKDNLASVSQLLNKPSDAGSTTSTAKQKRKLTDTQFDRMRKIVYDKSGIWFADAKKYVLESRLERRLEELEMENFDQYITFLTIGPYRDDEFQEMFNRITINETSFFRNEPQLDVFEKKVLPKIMEARKSTKRLRIWSAACSTGEEPYTIAMQLHRSLGVRLTDWHIEILGTDISERALLVAQQGRYGSYALRSTNPLIIRRYFKQADAFYQIDPEIQSMVTLEKHNLKDQFAAKRHGQWDVIFCRNVMIYFDDEMRKNCLSLFHSVLADDGMLFIGHSETIRDGRFEPMPDPQAFAYHKVVNKGLTHGAA